MGSGHGARGEHFEGHRQLIRCLAFSADGSLLATGSDDNTAMVWDVFGRLDNGPPGKKDFSAEQLQSLWTDLRTKDARVAYRAMCRLLASRQTVPFLKKQLKPVAALDARRRKQMSQWIADLDSPQFETRQKAAMELEKLGDLAEPALRAALADKPSLEVRRPSQTDPGEPGAFAFAATNASVASRRGLGAPRYLRGPGIVTNARRRNAVTPSDTRGKDGPATLEPEPSAVRRGAVNLAVCIGHAAAMRRSLRPSCPDRLFSTRKPRLQ